MNDITTNSCNIPELQSPFEQLREVDEDDGAVFAQHYVGVPGRHLTFMR